MTEYIIIVALIAVAAIAVYQFFGQTIRSQMSAIANEVGGQVRCSRCHGCRHRSSQNG